MQVVFVVSMLVLIALASAEEAQHKFWPHPNLDEQLVEAKLRCSACRAAFGELHRRLKAKHPEDAHEAGVMLESVCAEEEKNYGLKKASDGVQALPEFVRLPEGETDPTVLKDDWVEEHWHSLCHGRLEHVEIQVILARLEMDPVDECPCPGDEHYFHVGLDPHDEL